MDTAPVGPAADVHVLGRRRLYMLPTRNGLYFALLLLVMLLAAVNYNNGLAYGFTFTLAAVGLVSMLYTQRNVSGLRVTVKDAEPVFAGQSAQFPIHIHNASDTRRPGVWVLSDTQSRCLDFAPQSSRPLALTVAAERRGYLQCPVFSVSSTFPFGLLYTWAKPMRPASRCLVYPAPGPRLPWPHEPAASQRHHRGQSLDGDDFVGLRTYQPADPPRHVHWKAAARGAGWLTKRFGDSTGGELWLDWAATHGGRMDERLGVICRWVLDAERAGLRYGLRLPDLEIEPDSGGRHLHRCLRSLALWDPGYE